MQPAIVAGTASAPFARSLADAAGASVVPGEAKRFPDGEGHVRLLDDVRDRSVAIVQSTAPDAAFVELLLWCDAAREAGARHITAVVPYFGYARQDRAFQPGEGVSARAALRALRANADAIVTVDLHKPDVLTHFGPSARDVSAVPEIAGVLGRWGVDAVLAPDKGARARAEAAARHLGVPFDHLEKTRLSPTEVSMKPKSLDVAGRRVAIVDDLIASGGTMATAARQLKEQGATKVYAACTHGLFTGNAAPRLLAGGIDRLLCTDTYGAAAPCDVVSAAPAVARVLADAPLARTA